MTGHTPTLGILYADESGVQKLVEYAIKMGHRRIAFIHGHDNSIVTRTRVSQYHNTMAYHDLPMPRLKSLI